MLNETDLRFLKETLTFWNNLNNNQQELIIKNTVSMKYKSGQNIYSSENECIGILLIKSGELRTYILSEEGKEVTLYRLNSGGVCVLSASCLIKNITFDIYISAECESEILLINAHTFSKILSENIYVENFSLKLAVDRFSDVVWTIEQILLMSFDRRLAIFLLDEISKTNSNTISLTHEQIAKYINSAREVVSRMLKYFSNEHIVELSRGEVKIINKEKLHKLINVY